MVILSLIIKRLVKLLKSESSPNQISLGFVLGMFLGFLSLKTLFSVPILLVIVLIKVNLASVLLAALLFRLIVLIFGPLIHSLGYFILVKISILHNFWTNLYNIPVMPLTRFNNTMVMGGLVLILVIAVPLYLGIKVLIENYRLKYEEKIKKWKVIKILSASRFVKWLSGLGKIGA